MISILWPQADARSVVQPEPTFLRLLLLNLKPFPTPDPLDAFDIHRPAFALQQGRDPAVAVPAVLVGKPDDVRSQRLFVGSPARLLALRRSMLAENPARHAFRHAELRDDMVDALPAPGRAQKFPDAASLRISFSSVRSETALSSRSFSFSRSFRRFT